MPGMNERRSPDKRIVNFGKYAGEKYGDVPTEYLEWFVGHHFHQMKARGRWAQEELIRRRAIKE